ncbi:Transcriptional regulator, GntR family domain / Aspartate aminotransferase [Cronobacter dublinensis 1210]|uniref:Transcriptional regulator, GntR family domain / Aspartate aminotransferase n=1 Tax=Cronobacter dublinensis 1210 TaxID=1208656 RepID=A0ABM9Q9R6_9ENTR|nr:Transcriptional regulator, GntR family domain / Aspartate aminotransferase [Cronobacter dublinensis 1210]
MKPGYREIYQRYRQNIHDGVLKPGDRVPSIRLLAQELQVAKKTVEAAYAVLVGEGYLVSRGPQAPASTRRRPCRASPTTPLSPSTRAARSLAKAKAICAPGIPSLDRFPNKKWLLLCARATRAMRPEEMVNPPVAGYAPLRAAIASYLTISRGVTCTADDIFITSGYRGNLLLTLQALLGPGESVALEEPGYFMGQRLLKTLAPALHPVPVDDEGMQVAHLQRHCPNARLAIVTPSHHSPLGVTLSLPRKQQLLAWASAHNAWIVEDDYDGEFHYTRNVLPSLKSLDTDDRVIYIGTFSKTIMPSVRIGYLVMPRRRVTPFLDSGALLCGGQPLLMQKILAAFLSGGDFYTHLKKCARSTPGGVRRSARCTRSFPACLPRRLRMAACMWWRISPRPPADEALARVWHQHQLQVSALSPWYLLPDKRYGLIIGYTNLRSYDEALALLTRAAADTRALLSGVR